MTENVLDLNIFPEYLWNSVVKYGIIPVLIQILILSSSKIPVLLSILEVFALVPIFWGFQKCLIYQNYQFNNRALVCLLVANSNHLKIQKRK